MATVFQCDRCGGSVAAKHFLMNVLWKPVGSPYEHDKFTEYELCPDCINALDAFVEVRPQVRLHCVPDLRAERIGNRKAVSAARTGNLYVTHVFNAPR